MRGPDIQQDALFSTVSPESRVPKDHPLRPIRAMTDAALRELDQDFDALYAESGRDSIPPEKLLRAIDEYRTLRLQWTNNENAMRLHWKLRSRNLFFYPNSCQYLSKCMQRSATWILDRCASST